MPHRATMPHRLAAVWFADIVGYGRLSSRNENDALQLVTVFQRACRDLVRHHKGRIVKFMGDGAMAEFTSTEAAVRAACALETVFKREAEGSDIAAPQLHVGVHVGEIASGPDGDLYGEGLNLAARLQALAGPGEILASEDVHRQLHHRPEFDFEALGERTIKDSDQPVAVFRVTATVAMGAMEEVGGWGSWRAWHDGVVRRGVYRRLAIYVLPAAVLVAAGLAFLLPSRRGPPTGEAAALPPNRVAVLYFDDFSSDSSLRYMADGLTEALIQELSAAPGLEVVSRNGVKPFEGASVSTDSIARALGAGTLVQGSVQLSGDSLRVRVQLIDGLNGEVVEGRTIERRRGDLFALQDDVARQVADFLRQWLGEEIRLAELRAGTRSVPAWEMVQLAERTREQTQPLVQAGALAEAGRQYDLADSLLMEGGRADTMWVVPVVRRGWLAHDRSRWYESSDVEEFSRWNAQAARYAEAAVLKDRSDADALELRGTVRFWRGLFAPDRDPVRATAQLAAAEADLRASVRANPDQAGAWSRLSQALAAQGDAQEAKVAAERAYEADAYLSNADEVLFRLFVMSFDLNQAREAKRWCLEGGRRFHENPYFTYCQLWLMTMEDIQPEPGKAWALLEQYDGLTPPQDLRRKKTAQMAVAAVLARAGLRDSAVAVAIRARGDEAIDPARELLYYEAFVKALANREREAVELLETYLRASPGQRKETSVTWWFEPLHDRTDFRTLVGEGSPQEP